MPLAWNSSLVAIVRNALWCFYKAPKFLSALHSVFLLMMQFFCLLFRPQYSVFYPIHFAYAALHWALGEIRCVVYIPLQFLFYLVFYLFIGFEFYFLNCPHYFIQQFAHDFLTSIISFLSSKIYPVIICALFDCFEIIEHVHICSFEFCVLSFIIVVLLREHFYGVDFCMGTFCFGLLQYLCFCSGIWASRFKILVVSFICIISPPRKDTRQTGGGLRAWLSLRVKHRLNGLRYDSVWEILFWSPESELLRFKKPQVWEHMDGMEHYVMCTRRHSGLIFRDRVRSPSEFRAWVTMQNNYDKETGDQGLRKWQTPPGARTRDRKLESCSAGFQVWLEVNGREVRVLLRPEGPRRIRMTVVLEF